MFMNSLFGENLFDDFFSDYERPLKAIAPSSRTVVMNTDVIEKEDAFELNIDLPGYKKEDVKAELKDGYLTVSACTKTENDEKNDEGKFIRRERFYGNCSRSFYVGKTVTESDIKAKFEDGILKLVVPKKAPEIPEPTYIAIEG